MGVFYYVQNFEKSLCHFCKKHYACGMNYYEKKLQEKSEYEHKKYQDKTPELKKNKIQRMKKVKKNAQLGIF